MPAQSFICSLVAEISEVDIKLSGLYEQRRMLQEVLDAAHREQQQHMATGPTLCFVNKKPKLPLPASCPEMIPVPVLQAEGFPAACLCDSRLA